MTARRRPRHGDALERLRLALRDRGNEPARFLRWLPGRPSFAFLEAGLAVIVHDCRRGCPFHGDGRPRERGEDLGAVGWTVIEVWAHELTTERKASEVAARVLTQRSRLLRVKGRRWFVEGDDPGQMRLPL